MAPSSTTHFSFPCFFQPERSLPFHSETHSGAIVCAGALEGCARSGIAIEKQKANVAARSSLCFIILFFILFFIASLPQQLQGELDLASRTGALAGSRILKSLLYQGSATDPATLAGIAAMLVIVAFLAAHLPARRAALVDPIIALGWE